MQDLKSEVENELATCLTGDFHGMHGNGTGEQETEKGNTERLAGTWFCAVRQISRQISASWLGRRTLEIAVYHLNIA